MLRPDAHIAAVRRRLGADNLAAAPRDRPA